jgi:hypothetical protein
MASHGAIIDLFERIESFFKRLEVYAQTSLTTKMAEVLVKIVIELLSILSIATKEVKRPLASELFEREMLRISLLMFFPELFARKLLGRKDIEDALKKLDILIQEEVQMAIAQILKATTEVKDGTRPYLPAYLVLTHITLNACAPRCRQNQCGYAADVG